MTPRALYQEVMNAFDARDRQSTERYAAELAASACPPDFSRLTREQLEDRQSALRVQLADINDRLVAMAAAGRRTQTLPAWPPADSLDPSDA